MMVSTPGIADLAALIVMLAGIFKLMAAMAFPGSALWFNLSSAVSRKLRIHVTNKRQVHDNLFHHNPTASVLKILPKYSMWPSRKLSTIMMVATWRGSLLLHG